MFGIISYSSVSNDIRHNVVKINKLNFPTEKCFTQISFAINRSAPLWIVQMIFSIFCSSKSTFLILFPFWIVPSIASTEKAIDTNFSRDFPITHSKRPMNKCRAKNEWNKFTIIKLINMKRLLEIASCTFTITICSMAEHRDQSDALKLDKFIWKCYLASMQTDEMNARQCHLLFVHSFCCCYTNRSNYSRWANKEVSAINRLNESKLCFWSVCGASQPTVPC